MALAQLLSAMKDIILDVLSMPEEQKEREVFLKKTFLELSQNELEDLSKINPAKLRLYSNSIFSGEKDLIHRNFPMTVAYLEKYWNLVSKDDFSLFKLIKNIHKTKPWKSYSTVDLGRNFVDFINQEFVNIISRVPFLPELAEMELLLRIVRRSPDDKIMPKDSLSLTAISSMTVEKILDLNFLIPTCVEFSVFSYDLISERAAFVENNDYLPDTIMRKNLYCSLSRNRECLQRWTMLPQSLFNALKTLPRYENTPLSLLAEKFLDAANQNSANHGADEESLFREFIGIIYRSMENGMIVVI